MLRLIVDGQTYSFDDARMLNIEAIALKKATGLNPQELWQGISAFDAEAITALVWLARRRTGERDLRYTAVEFDLGGMDMEEIDDQGRVVTRDKKTHAITHLDGLPVEPDPTTPPPPGAPTSNSG